MTVLVHGSQLLWAAILALKALIHMAKPGQKPLEMGKLDPLSGPRACSFRATLEQPAQTKHILDMITWKGGQHKNRSRYINYPVISCGHVHMETPTLSILTDITWYHCQMSLLKPETARHKKMEAMKSSAACRTKHQNPVEMASGCWRCHHHLHRCATKIPIPYPSISQVQVYHSFQPLDSGVCSRRQRWRRAGEPKMGKILLSCFVFKSVWNIEKSIKRCSSKTYLKL